MPAPGSAGDQGLPVKPFPLPAAQHLQVLLARTPPHVAVNHRLTGHLYRVAPAARGHVVQRAVVGQGHPHHANVDHTAMGIEKERALGSLRLTLVKNF